MRLLMLAGAAALLLAAAPVAPALAQQRPTPAQPDTNRTRADTMRMRGPVAAVPADSDHLRVRPRTAFIRSLILPGWGQFSAGAPRSGAVFVALQASSDFMLVKTLKKLSDARALDRTAQSRFRDSLFTELAKTDTATLHRWQNNPIQFQTSVLDTLPSHSLVLSRQKQREDWITLAVFWTLASAVDALVVAELSDFPAEVGIEPRAGGGMLLRMGIRTRRPW